MPSGPLRHRVSIETISSSQDAYGQIHDAIGSPDTIVFAKVWGEVEDLSGADLFAAMEQHSQITTRIKIRFFPGIQPAMVARVPMDQRTRLFDILSVTDMDGRRRFLRLQCKERFD